MHRSASRSRTWLLGVNAEAANEPFKSEVEFGRGAQFSGEAAAEQSRSEVSAVGRG